MFILHGPYDEHIILHAKSQIFKDISKELIYDPIIN